MPYIERIELRVIDKYLVIASDGLWDVVSDHVIHKNKSVDWIICLGSNRHNKKSRRSFRHGKEIDIISIKELLKRQYWCYGFGS